MTQVLVPKKGMAQQNEFMNNTYDFPAKPRNEIEIGISGGMFSISGMFLQNCQLLVLASYS